MHATTISMHNLDLKRKFLEALVKNQHHIQVKESLQQEKVQQKFKGYEMKEDGVLMHKNRIYFPSLENLGIWY